MQIYFSSSWRAVLSPRNKVDIEEARIFLRLLRYYKGDMGKVKEVFKTAKLKKAVASKAREIGLKTLTDQQYINAMFVVPFRQFLARGK